MSADPVGLVDERRLGEQRLPGQLDVPEPAEGLLEQLPVRLRP